MLAPLGGPLEQRRLPARWWEAGHERSAGVGARWGAVEAGCAQSAVRHGRDKTAPPARHSWPLCHNPQPLCPLTAPKTGAAQKYGCRGEKQTQRPSVPSWHCLPPAPSRGRAFGPGVTAAASPLPSPKQAHPLGAHHPPTPTPGPGQETETWRRVTFPQHSLGWGSCPAGSAPRLTAETPHKRPQTLCAFWLAPRGATVGLGQGALSSSFPAPQG